MSQQHVPDESANPAPEQPEVHSEGALTPDARTPLFRAYNSERYQRQEIIRHIQSITKRRLICYVAGSSRKCIINRNDTVPFVDLLHNMQQGESVELLLHTAGGSVDTAEKLIRLLRSRVGEDTEVRVIVPEFAKSAGTVMVLGADCVVMSDTSELGPIDPQMEFADSHGNVRLHSVQTYLDAYDEHYRILVENPDNVASRMMPSKIDPDTVTLCKAVMARARQSAEYLLMHGMFRKGGNITQTVSKLLDTKRWLSHSQMISWADAGDPEIGLIVEYLRQDDDLWQAYWRLYCLQRLAIEDHDKKLYESDRVSHIIDAS